MSVLVYKKRIVVSGNSDSAAGGSIITLSTENIDLFGETLTLVIGDYSTNVTLSDSGSVTIDGFTKTGTMNVYYGEDLVDTISIPYYGEYVINNIALLPIHEAWLKSINHDKTGYNNLIDVLSDEELVRELFSRHASVDFLASHASMYVDDIETILNHNNSIKWINLRDYALDKLSSNTVIKEIMDEVDKYGYGEWGLVPMVPVMTSATPPYGTLTYSDQHGGSYAAWGAFNPANTSINWLASSGASNHWIQYQFPEAVKINAMYMHIYFDRISSLPANPEIILYGSNDNSTYVELARFTINKANYAGSQFDETFYIYFENDTYYTTYKWTCAQVLHQAGSNGFFVRQIQYSSWGFKGLVPIMNDNSSSYGVASNYQVFDRILPTTISGTDFSYQFTNPVRVRKYTCKNASGADITGGVLQGSNDGSNFTDINDVSSNNTYYLYYRLHFTSSQTVGDIQFYGTVLKVLSSVEPDSDIDYVQIDSTYYTRDYQEYGWDTDVPRHYIYDHGLQLETLVKDKTNHATIAELDNSLFILAYGTAGHKSAFITPQIDLTDYSLMKVTYGDKVRRYGCEIIINSSQSFDWGNKLAGALVSLSDLPYNASIDISSINQNACCCYGLYLGSQESSYINANITEWWLE